MLSFGLGGEEMEMVLLERGGLRLDGVGAGLLLFGFDVALGEVLGSKSFLLALF